MHVQLLAKQQFDQIITYLHTGSCKLVVSTQRTDQFITKVGLSIYIVIKDTLGRARAYVNNDTIYVREED